jgi:general secretion pathway protein G
MFNLFSKKTSKVKALRAFTLIELLVVIAIIGILSSVVLASLNTARLKSRDTRRLADIKQIQNALALYFDANSSYPADIYAASVLAPTYISQVPQDPVGQINYPYTGLDTNTDAATCESYHIGATLEEGTNKALDGDIDAAVGTECTGSVVDFDGADPVYDQRP